MYVIIYKWYWNVLPGQSDSSFWLLWYQFAEIRIFEQIRTYQGRDSPASHLGAHRSLYSPNPAIFSHFNIRIFRYFITMAIMYKSMRSRNPARRPPPRPHKPFQPSGIHIISYVDGVPYISGTLDWFPYWGRFKLQDWMDGIYRYSLVQTSLGLLSW